MKIFKTTVFAFLILPLLIGGKCFVVSSFDSSDDDDDDEGLIIVITNAESTSNEVMQSLNQTLAVAEIASQSAQYANDYMESDLHSYVCDNANGSIMLTLNDLDHSNRISVGDDFLLNYTNCNVDQVIANGNQRISVLDAKGIDIGKFDTGTDWSFILSVNADSFQVSTENEVLIVNGDMEIALNFNATTASLKGHITNNQLVLDDGSQTLLTNMNISQLISLAVVPSSYSLTIDSMKISSGAPSTTVNASTPLSPLAGIELLSLSEFFVDLHLPENGEINIAGKNSNADVSIMSDELISIDIDTNGDSISDEQIFSTLSKLK